MARAVARAGIILEQIGTGVIAIDRAGLVSFYNRAAQDVLGVPVDRVLGCSCASLVDGAEPMRTIAGALAAGLVGGCNRARMQLEVDTPGGRRVLGYGLHILDDAAIVAMVFTDLSETLDRERRAHDERQVSDAGRLASAMAHELKSPLATIGLYVDLLRRQLPADGPASGNLDVIAEQLVDCRSRLSTILHSMAGTAAGDSGLRLSSLAGAIEDIIDEQRLRAPQTELRLSVSGDGRVALNHGDLSSIVGNLVNNAVEAGDGAGPVEVTVTCSEGTALVTVADRGPGLPGGDVFVPFFSTKGQGTGLGLWLVRRLALDAGGHVTAADRDGGGALFTVLLPIADRSRLAGRQVLVVDDDEHLTAALAAALREAGSIVYTASSAEEVADTGASWRFDCAVFDYRLPGIDGVSAAARLPGLPILLVSSDETAAAVLATSGRKHAWFMAKPFPLEDLLDALTLLLARRS